MEAYKSMFLLTLTVTISSLFFYGSVVEASARKKSDVAPVAAPASSPAAYAPGSAPEDINIDFDEGASVQDFIPVLQQIPHYDFSYLPVDKRIRDLCDGTDYINECIATILPAIRKRGGGDGKSGLLKPSDVLGMMTHSLYNKTNATLEYAKGLMNDKSTPEKVKKPLQSCTDNYESLLHNLKEATKAADEKDYSRLETVLSATISEVTTCTDAFGEVPDTDSPTADLDDFLKKLCSNVLAISQLIQY